jgi:hypothetical protein
MINLRTSLKVLVLVSLAAVPAFGANLLTNPSFSGTPASTTIAGWTNPGSPQFTINNNYPGAAPGQDNDNQWVGSSAAYSSGTKTPELRQTVTVVPQTPYRLSVWVHTDGSPNTCSAFLQWKNGAATGNGQCTTIASFTSNTPPGAWQQLSGSVVPTGTQLTICLKLSWNAGGSGGGGNFDVASVDVDTSCPNPSTVASVIDPATNQPFVTVPPYPASETLTINGNNLLNVTAVNLNGPALITGSIIESSRTNTSFQATFNLTGQPTGGYNVTVTRILPCLDTTLDNGFEIRCDDAKPAATVTGFEAASAFGLGGARGTSHATLNIEGTNLGSLDGVVLRKSYSYDVAATPDIVGSLQDATDGGTKRAANFNLVGAEAGRYDVIYQHPCGNVTPVQTDEGFLVYLDRLENGNFEEGYKADLTTGAVCPADGTNNKPESQGGHADRPKARHWDRYRPASVLHYFWDNVGTVGGGISGHARDASIFLPCDSDPQAGLTGHHYSGMTVYTWSSDDDDSRHAEEQYVSFYQTIKAPYINSSGVSTFPFQLDGKFLIRWDANGGGNNGTTATGWVRLIDGTVEDGGADVGGETNTRVIGMPVEIPASSTLQQLAGGAAVPSGQTYQSEPKLLTIEFRFKTPQRGKYCPGASYAFYVQDVQSSASICNTTVRADVDGDGDVDQADFAVFQSCYSPGGPIPASPTYCICFDTDGQNGIDQSDLSSFEACATGPGVPWVSSADCP